MTGFELRISDIGSDRSTNCATTTALFNGRLMHTLKRVIAGLGIEARQCDQIWRNFTTLTKSSQYLAIF